jgi:outer membrane protein assembly factor BamB
MRRLRSLATAVALVALAGCGAFGWLPWVDKEPDPNAPAELTKYKAEVRIDRRWGGRVGEGLGKKYLRLSPHVVADRVALADAYGHVEMRERFKGKRLWKTSIGKPDKKRLRLTDRRDPAYVTGGVGGGEGLVLIGTANAEIVALVVGDGAERWRVGVSSEVLAAPTAADGLAYATTSDGRVVALDVATGAQRWTYDTQVPALSLRGTAAPVVSAGVVLTGFANGKVGAFRAATGEPLWEQRIMLPQGRSELERIVDVDGTPLIVAGAVYAASFQGRIKALRPADGNVLWEREASTSVDLAQGGGHIYLVDEDDVIRAYDQRNAELAWEQRGLFRRKLSAPTAIGSYLVVGDDEGYVHVLAQGDGRFVGRRKIDAKGVRSNMIAADNFLYVLGNSGKVAALEITPRK